MEKKSGTVRAVLHVICQNWPFRQTNPVWLERTVPLILQTGLSTAIITAKCVCMSSVRQSLPTMMGHMMNQSTWLLHKSRGRAFIGWIAVSGWQCISAGFLQRAGCLWTGLVMGTAKKITPLNIPAITSWHWFPQIVQKWRCISPMKTCLREHILFSWKIWALRTGCFPLWLQQDRIRVKHLMQIGFGGESRLNRATATGKPISSKCHRRVSWRLPHWIPDGSMVWKHFHITFRMQSVCRCRIRIISGISRMKSWYGAVHLAIWPTKAVHLNWFTPTKTATFSVSESKREIFLQTGGIVAHQNPLPA